MSVPDVSSSLSTPRAWALAYASIGWHVLPLEPGQKHPLGRLVPRGMLDATTDAGRIAGWWNHAPNAGVGIALAPSGLVALDIDPRNGGTDTFDLLQAAHGSLRSEVMAFTGGNGEHHVFVVPAGVQVSLPGTLGPGVDVKANGYIVVEPSIHPSGKQYVWEASSNPLDGVAPSPLPDWLRSFRVRLDRPQPEAGATPVDPVQARDLREALYLLDADDYDEWIKAGMALHATGWGFPAYAMWCAWSQQSSKFDATVSRKKWDTFTSDPARAGLSPAFVYRIAQERGWVNPKARLAMPPQDPEPALEAANDAEDDGIPVLDLAALQKAAQSVSWVIKHVVPAESVGLMFGASGTFKSFLAIDMALHVAHGIKWMGHKTRQGPVLYIAAEGGAGLWKRVEAWHGEHGINWQDAPFHVVPVSVDLGMDAIRVADAATRAGVAPALVVVDTLSQTFGGEENSAADVSRYLREIGLHFRQLWQCAVVVIHHSGHVATERPRGSSALRSNVDFMMGVHRDETEMLATLSCGKQKDGELFKDSMFAMSVVDMGQDKDGDAITALVARAVMDEAEKADLVRHEASKGRSGRNAQLLAMAQNGMTEKELRQAFYDSVDGDSDARRQAYHRALGWAKKSGLLEIAQGYVLVLKGGKA